MLLCTCISFFTCHISAWGRRVEKTDCGGIPSQYWYDLSSPYNGGGGLGLISLAKCILECKKSKESKFVLYGRPSSGSFPCKNSNCKCYCSLGDSCDENSRYNTFDMYTIV